MNISKRIVTLLMCVAMLLSMSTSFAFALGNDADTQDVVTDSNVIDTPIIETEEKEEATVGSSTFAPGPNPTTNVEAPVITATTVVYDSTATADAEYTLNFVDKSTGKAVDSSAWTAEFGTNLFNNFVTALEKAGSNGNGVLLVMNDVPIVNGSVSAQSNAISIYTPYFNVMPYTVGTAYDGSDWKLNQDFVDNAPAIVGDSTNYYLDLNIGVNFFVYGLSTKNCYFNARGGKVGKAIKIHYTNIYSSAYGIIDCSFQANNSDGYDIQKNGSEYVLKNAYFSGASASKPTTYTNFFYGCTYPKIVFDGVWMQHVGTTASGNGWCKMGPKSADITVDFTIKNSNFYNVTLNELHQSYAKTDKASYNILNNVFRDSTLGCDDDKKTYNTAVPDGILGKFYNKAFEKINIKDNVFISTNGKYKKLFTANNASASVTLTFTGNLLNGVEPIVNFSSFSWTPSSSSVINNNYATATYSADLTNVESVPVTATNNHHMYASSNYDSYFDAAGTTLRSQLAVTDVATENGVVALDNAPNYTISWYRNSAASAEALAISLPEGVTGKWYTADGTETTAADITAAGSYLYKTTNGTYTLTYTVKVAEAPENSFHKAFETDGIIKNTAILAVTASNTTAIGSVYEATWNGTKYSFVKGVNVFDAIKEAEAHLKAQNITDGQVLVLNRNSNKETNHIKATWPASYYSQNYNNSPVKVLDTPDADGSNKASNIGTEAGQFDTSKGVSLDGISVEASAPEGTYGFYGFQISWDIYHKVKNNSKMIVKNTYFLVSNSVSNADGYGLIGTTYGQSSANYTAFAGVKNSIDIENFYVATRSGATRAPRLFVSGVMPAFTTFKNAFFDFPTGIIRNNGSWANVVGKESAVAFEDCLFKNMKYEGASQYLGIESDKNSVASGENKTLTFKNNTFVNSWLADTHVVCVSADELTGFTFTGNKVYNDTNKGLILFPASYVRGAGVPLKLTVTDNYVKYGTQAVDMGERELTADSVVEGNYINTNSTLAGLTLNGMNVKYSTPAYRETIETYYWVDAAKTIESTDVALDFNATANGKVVFVKADNTVNFYYDNAAASLADLAVTVPETAEITYLDSTGAEITDLAAYGTANSVAYIKSAAKNSESTDNYIVYTVNIKAFPANYFNTTFTDSANLINSEKALLLTNEAALANAAFGDVVTLTWCGKEYDFIKGVNAFPTLFAAETYAKANGIDTPSILAKNKTETKRFMLTDPAHVFTQNYNVSPITVGKEKDGSDWSANIGTGAGQFNTDLDVRYDDIGMYKDISYPEGDYWFYGFTINYAFYSKSANDGNVKLVNSRFVTGNWANGTTAANDPISFANKEKDGVETIEINNVYFSLSSNDTHGKLTAGKLPENVIFDTIFVDVPDGAQPCSHNANVIQCGSKTTYVIKNSLFKNYQLVKVGLAAEADTVAGDDRAIVVHNNIFINSQFRTSVSASTYDGLICFAGDDFTRFELTDNYVYNEKSTAVFSIMDPATKFKDVPFTLKITGNEFYNVGSANQSFPDKGFTADSIIADNYVQLVDTDYGTKFQISGAKLTKNWLISADGENTSSKIQPFTFNGGDVVADNTIIAEADAATINLKSFFKNVTATSAANENVYKVYTNEDCDAESLVDATKVPVAAAGSKVYVKVASPDGTTEGTDVYEIIINKKVAYTVGNEAKGSTLIQHYNGNNYYWVGWRGQVEGTGTAASDISGSRVGTLFLSDTTNLKTMKDDIAAGVAAMTDIDETSAVIEAVNADEKFATGAAANTIKAYTMSDDNTNALTWDSKTQSYGYRYNFGIIEGKYRATVMFAVYQDSNGDYQVVFSDTVVQQAGAK